MEVKRFVYVEVFASNWSELRMVDLSTGNKIRQVDFERFGFM